MWRKLLGICSILLAVLGCAPWPGSAYAASAPARSAIATLPVSGGDACTTSTLRATDDGSTGLVPLPFGVNFFGSRYRGLYVNNNGNVTFDTPLSTFTPFELAAAERVIIAPFFADVDTRGAGSAAVTYSSGAATFEGRPAFCVNWVDVGYFDRRADKRNSFQLLLVDRSDIAAGDFDIVFNYGRIAWEAGDENAGFRGLGGDAARAGYSNGTAEYSFELPGSATPGALLDSNRQTGLVHGSNAGQPGRYVFPVRGGIPSNLPAAIFEYNAFVLGDLTLSASETGGRVAAGGDARLTSYSIGSQLTAAAEPRDDLVVGGRLFYSDGSVYQGSVVSGQAATLTRVSIPNGEARRDTPLDFAAARSAAEAASDSWAALPVTGRTSVTVWGGSAEIILTGTRPDLNVFALSGRDLARASTLTIRAPAGSTVLINVTGASRMQSFGTTIEGTNRQRVLYNMPDATALEIGSVGVEGSVWAPRAAVTFSSGSIAGTLLAAELSGSGRFEHRPFQGELPLP
jgi:choice-of-anchor A domain-containing protein